MFLAFFGEVSRVASGLASCTRTGGPRGRRSGSDPLKIEYCLNIEHTRGVPNITRANRQDDFGSDKDKGKNCLFVFFIMCYWILPIGDFSKRTNGGCVTTDSGQRNTKQNEFAIRIFALGESPREVVKRPTPVVKDAHAGLFRYYNPLRS